MDRKYAKILRTCVSNDPSLVAHLTKCEGWESGGREKRGGQMKAIYSGAERLLRDLKCHVVCMALDVRRVFFENCDK